MYLYETHCHCSWCSACATSSPEEQVRAYAAAGYAGLVLTDHFIRGNTAVDRNLPWAQRMHCYYDAYLAAKKAAEDLDFDVIFGIEHQYGGGKEVLLYGIGLDFLLENDDIPTISLDELVDRVHKVGGVVIQAHPYRNRAYINMDIHPREELLDGVEIYNACAAPGEDLQALALAARHGEYILTSGGDIHRDDDPRIGAAGILLPRRVKDGKEFAAALKERAHLLRIGGEDLEEVLPRHLGG